MEYFRNNPTLNDMSVYQDEENDFYADCFIRAARNGYLHVAGQDESLENSYRELCEKEARPLILLDDNDVAAAAPKLITVARVRPEQVDQLVGVATEAGARIVEVDRLAGRLVVSTDEMAMDDVARHLALAVKPAASGDRTEEGETVATVDNIGLTRRELNALSHAFTVGYLPLEPCFGTHGSFLYSLTMELRGRPSILVMPKWGERRSVVVLSLRREAIRRSAQSARDAGAEVIVEAEVLNLMCAVCENERADAVAEAICADWKAYEKEPWPRPQTAIEKQVLALTSGG